MKTIELSAKQRQEIQDRRRLAGDRRFFQRLSTLLWIDEGRTREEVAQARKSRDPLVRFGAVLQQLGVASAEALKGLDEEVKAEVERAVEFGEQSPEPGPPPRNPQTWRRRW